MKKGIIVSFSGVDGSGKTTQVKMLIGKLEKENKSVREIKIFEYFLLKPIINFFSKRDESSARIVNKKNKNPLFYFWCSIALFDFWLMHISKIKPLSKKYDYLISDRSFVDMAVAQVTYGYMPEWLFNSYIKLLPKLDIEFVLNINPEEAKKRSQEFNLDYYIEQENLYKTSSVNRISIDANQDTSKISEEIQRYIKSYE